MPANSLELKLLEHDEEMRRRALRYFLEYEDKGRGILERRRKKKAAKFVLTTLQIIEKRVHEDERKDALRRVKLMLVNLVRDDI